MNRVTFDLEIAEGQAVYMPETNIYIYKSMDGQQPRCVC